MDTPSFDKSSYVVVNTNSNSRRRRAGSFGELQPSLKRELSQWEFTATFDDETPVQDTNVVMMERYDSLKHHKPRLTAKDFMDGSDFLQSTNLFRDSHTSQRWHMDVMERPNESFDDANGMNDLFHELHVGLNTPEKQYQSNTGLPDAVTPMKDLHEDYATEPTTPATEPTTTPSSSVPSSDRQKHKKEHRKKHKKKKRHSRLPSVVPPKEIDTSDSVTVASSIGGVSHIPKMRNLLEKEACLPRSSHDELPANIPASEVDVSAQMTVASSVGQDSAWVKPKRRSPREIDISAPITVQSSLGGESILRPSVQERRSRPRRKSLHLLDKVKSIDVSDPTVVSSLGEPMDFRKTSLPISREKLYPTQEYRSLHHQLYSGDSR